MNTSAEKEAKKKYEREVEIERHENSNRGAAVIFQVKRTFSYIVYAASTLPTVVH
jgi:hypothetical protein